jgi:hypothetical protein
MLKTFVAALALCPLMIQAQAISPAQPKSAVTNPVLVSSLVMPSTPGAFFAAGGAIPENTPMRVSSGVTAPKLLVAPQIAQSVSWSWNPAETQRLAVVSLVVDESGKPSDVHMVKSLGASIDKDVIASVSHFRFAPGTLNHESVAMPLELRIKILNQ